MMGLLAEFKKGRDAAYAARGFSPGRRMGESEGAADAGEPQTDAAELAETRRELLEELAAEAETLQKRIGELETERDDGKKLLADVVAEGEKREERVAKLEAERDEAKTLLAELTESVEARTADIEGERDLLVEALLVPGARKMLLKTYLPDANPDADDDQREALTEASSKINAAYDLIDRITGKKPERSRL